MGTTQPLLPRLKPGDLVLRNTAVGWLVEDAGGRQICEVLHTIAEARLIGRTFVAPRGRVWICDRLGWSMLDPD